MIMQLKARRFAATFTVPTHSRSALEYYAMPEQTAASQRTPRPAVGHVIFWFVLYTALWALLSGNAGWYLGLPSVALATFVAVQLQLLPWTMRLQHLPLFTFFFLLASLLGALDVARRTLRLKAQIDPGWTRYDLHCQDPRHRLLLSAIIGLLPGTLCSRIEGDQLHIHLLDQSAEWQATARKLEQHLQKLFIEVRTSEPAA